MDSPTAAVTNTSPLDWGDSYAGRSYPLGLYRFWAGLDNKQFASDAILRPLNVHRGVCVPENSGLQSDTPSQLENFVIKGANFPVP